MHVSTYLNNALISSLHLYSRERGVCCECAVSVNNHHHALRATNKENYVLELSNFQR